MELKDCNQRITRWQLCLHNYNYEIHYTKGEKNILADRLTRNFVNPTDLMQITKVEQTTYTDREKDEIIRLVHTKWDMALSSQPIQHQ